MSNVVIKITAHNYDLEWGKEYSALKMDDCYFVNFGTVARAILFSDAREIECKYAGFEE